MSDEGACRLMLDSSSISHIAPHTSLIKICVVRNYSTGSCSYAANLNALSFTIGLFFDRLGGLTGWVLPLLTLCG